MGFGEASYYLPGRSSIQKWKCVVAHFVPLSVAGSYQVSWCMQCTAECLRFAGVRQMQSFFVFNSLRCDPGSSGMWLMRAINIPDLVGSQPCTHIKTCMSMLVFPKLLPQKMAREEKKKWEEGRNQWIMKKALRQSKTPCLLPPTYSFHPLAIILQTLPACLPASTLWLTAARVGVWGSLSTTVIEI